MKRSLRIIVILGLFSFNWLVIIWRGGRGDSFRIGCPRSRTRKNFGRRQTREVVCIIPYIISMTVHLIRLGTVVLKRKQQKTIYSTVLPIKMKNLPYLAELDEVLTRILLYGELLLDDLNRFFIITSTIEYILVTKRFDVLSFNPPCD